MALRAVIWCAVSTKAQVDDRDSLPVQESDARALCDREGWNVVAVLTVPGHSRRYIDIHEVARAMSQRGIDAFTRLMDLWDQAAFDVLIVRDGNRFARTQALHAYVVERTIDSGARIYVMSKGWVDEQNKRMFIAMDGYSSAGDVDRLMQFHEMGLNRRAANGLPPTRPILPYQLIPKAKGSPAHLELRPELRRLWDDLATLFTAGVAWNELEEQLTAQYGHPRYPDGTFRLLIFNPWFWGNSARHYREAPRQNTWVFDPGELPPEGVIIHYGTHEPVYTGEQSDLVKSEIRRRQESIYGRSRPGDTHQFTGLLVCDTCNRNLIARWNPHTDGTRRVVYFCNSRWKRTSYCTETIRVHESDVQRWISDLFTGVHFDSTLLGDPAQVDATRRVSQLVAEIEQLERTLENLIMDQAAAPGNIRAVYTRKIGESSQRLDAMQRELITARRNAESDDTIRVRGRALSEIKTLGIPGFWTLPNGDINRMLHQVFGNKRLWVAGGKLIAIGPWKRIRGRG